MEYDSTQWIQKLPFDRLIRPTDGAGRALARLDERLKRLPELAAGFRTRSHFLEAHASMWLDGNLVHLEDLVLHDARADIRVPTHELTRAAEYLRARRRLETWPADRAIDRAGVLALAGRGHAGKGEVIKAWSEGEGTTDPQHGRDELDIETPDAYDRMIAEIDTIAERAGRLVDNPRPEKVGETETENRTPLHGTGHDEDGRLRSFFSVAEQVDSLPPVLAAAVLLDAWLGLEPLENRHELGRLIAADALRRTATPNHLPLVATGLRQSPFRRRQHDPLGTRLAMLLDGFEVGAREAMDQVNRLQLARERMLRCCVGLRRHSRLPALVNLFTAYPFVSIPIARKQLGVTAAAVDRMFEQLGPALPHELTGRGRYRAWGIL